MKDMIDRVTAAIGHSPEDTLPAKAAIRAVFEHLRDNALPLLVRAELNKAMKNTTVTVYHEDDYEIDDDQGEFVFLAGVEKILEGLK